jgi:hypothetical protein
VCVLEHPVGGVLIHGASFLFSSLPVHVFLATLYLLSFFLFYAFVLVSLLDTLSSLNISGKKKQAAS